MRARTIVALTVSIAWSASSCSKPSGAEYFPERRSGEQKTYTIEMNVPVGGAQKGRLAVRGEGTETINGKVYSKVVTVTSGIPGVPPQVRYERRDKNGLYAIDADDSTKTEYLDAPLPVRVGSTWTTKSAKGEVHYRAEAIEASQLFDRTYEKCLKISFSKSDSEGYTYYAPGVGQVKSVVKSNGVTIELTLDK